MVAWEEGCTSVAWAEPTRAASPISRRVGVEAIFAPIVGTCGRIALTSEATVAIYSGTGGMCAAIVSTCDATEPMCVAI
jgi:hypothetical protein